MSMLKVAPDELEELVGCIRRNCEPDKPGGERCRPGTLAPYVCARHQLDRIFAGWSAGQIELLLASRHDPHWLERTMKEQQG